MEYRQYLIHNADNIIKYNQVAANSNCSTILTPLNLMYMSSAPIMYNYITNTPLSYDNNSDLKHNYLNKVINISGTASLGIKYN